LLSDDATHIEPLPAVLEEAADGVGQERACATQAAEPAHELAVAPHEARLQWAALGLAEHPGGSGGHGLDQARAARDRLDVDAQVHPSFSCHPDTPRVFVVDAAQARALLSSGRSRVDVPESAS
jgi:hypothetical protein